MKQCKTTLAGITVPAAASPANGVKERQRLMTKTTSTQMPPVRHVDLDDEIDPHPPVGPAIQIPNPDSGLSAVASALTHPSAQAEEQHFLLQLATNPAVDVAKLQAILQMHKDVKAQQARTAFNRAFTALQPELPVIDETAKTDKTTYAPLEDIVEAVRPLCQKHGFSFGWESFFPPDGQIRVVCTLTHVEGHERTCEFSAATDATGSKNAIQARASAVSYGQRYTLKALLGIVTRKVDDDGERGGKGGEREPVARPKDYMDRMDDLVACADNGTKALEAAWLKLPQAFRLYVNEMDRARWEKVKVRAAEADRQLKAAAKK